MERHLDHYRVSSCQAAGWSAGRHLDDRVAGGGQQAAGGCEQQVAVCYELEETLGVSETPRVYGFRVGAYDRSRALVLDPVVLFSCGYIGGEWDDWGYGIAVDSEGNAYVTGGTHSTETTFPDTVGPDLSHNDSEDAFVAKVGPGGATLLYCGYIGGSGDDSANDVALQHIGDDYTAYIVGTTDSSESQGFPVTIGPDLTFNDTHGQDDAFVARVGPNHAPKLGIISPANGHSATGEQVTVSTSWQDPDGWRDLKQCYFHIGASPSLAGNMTLMYNRPKNKLWLLSDDGLNWRGGCEVGDVSVIQNSQGGVYCWLTEVTNVGADTLSVQWELWFKSGYTGTKKTGLKCKDRHKAKAKGAWKGTWTITN